MMSHIWGTGGEDLRDASVFRAAEGAVRACFASAGQLCVSMERIFIAERLVEFFADNNSDEGDYRIGEKIVKSARTSDVAWTIRDWTHRCITATLIATTVGVASSEMTTDISRRAGKSTDRICLTHQVVRVVERHARRAEYLVAQWPCSVQRLESHSPVGGLFGPISTVKTRQRNPFPFRANREIVIDGGPGF
jgi:hypothetical protein